MLMGGFVQFVISQFYQKFATDALLLDSAAVGGIFFISRATDAVLDPVCGYLSDRWRTRRGFIALGLLALGGGTLLAFAPALTPWSTAQMKYALVACGIFTVYLGVTLVYIPHYAWLSALQQSHAGLPFFASRAVAENFGTILGGAALALLVPYQAVAALASGGGSLIVLIGVMVAVLALLGAIPLALYRGVAGGSPQSPSFLTALRLMGKNRRFTLVAAMSFCNQFAATTLLAVSLYYTDYVLGHKELGVTIAIIFLLSATACVPGWSYLSRRISRHRLWMIALLVILAVFPTLLVTEAGYLWYLHFFAVLVGGAAGAVILFVPQEVSDVTGQGEGDAGGGLYFAAFTFVNKSAMAFSPLVIGLVLSSVGYDPAQRTRAVAQGVTFLFVALPALAFLISALLLRLYTRPRS
jgi:glycoside/pentoside/hexuronide:cation symporter, GPH family